MKLSNLHCHKIDIYFLDYAKTKKNSWKQKNDVSYYDIKKKAKKLESLDHKKNIEITKNNSLDDLYIIICNFCDKIYDDYESESEISIDNYYSVKASVFCSKSSFSKYDFNNFKCYEFVELKNHFLIGTKNEINLYLCESYNSLEEKISQLTSNNEKNENLIIEFKNELDKEKSKKEKIKKEKENIEEENNSLKINLKKEKKLNSESKKSIEELKSEQENLKRQITNLTFDLDSEQKKNKELNDKLDKISFENNANIRKVLEQVENEKSINKNLSSNISELKKVSNKQKIDNEALVKSINQKDNEIQILKRKNNSLGSNIDELKNTINIKEKTIQTQKESLIKERNNNANLSKNLKSEIEYNKKLEDKLDNIAIEHNKNTSEIIKKFDEETKQKDDIIKKKEEELIKEKQKNNPENSEIKFKSDCKIGEYDIVLHINSIIGLIKDGWNIEYKKNEGKQNFLKKKDEPTVVVGVIGNKNVGKTFILEKLSGYIIPNGFNIKTIGLSIRYGSTLQHNIAILDSAGQETPLLYTETSKIKENLIQNEENEVINENEQEDKENENQNDKNDDENGNKKTEEIEDEKDKEFEKYSRDKLITEIFIQKFIIWKSDILVLVVGNISLTEQKLLYTVKQEVKKLNKNQNLNKYNIWLSHSIFL